MLSASVRPNALTYEAASRGFGVAIRSRSSCTGVLEVLEDLRIREARQRLKRVFRPVAMSARCRPASGGVGIVVGFSGTSSSVGRSVGRWRMLPACST
ncbi:unnamed protein product [Polarella glacialis]|nr:unnamed protein product [Polarella glacialis]